MKNAWPHQGNKENQAMHTIDGLVALNPADEHPWRGQSYKTGPCSL